MEIWGEKLQTTVMESNENPGYIQCTIVDVEYCGDDLYLFEAYDENHDSCRIFVNNASKYDNLIYAYMVPGNKVGLIVDRVIGPGTFVMSEDDMELIERELDI